MIKEDIIFLAAVLALSAGHYAVWRGGQVAKYRLLGAAALLPFFAAVYSVTAVGWENCLIPAYIGAAAYSLAFTAESPKRFLPAAAAVWVCPIAAAVLCLNAGGYRKPVYLDDFNDMFGMMKKYYVLSDYKQIDWDALHAEYEPQVAALARDSDRDYFSICYRFCEEFNDLHVSAIDAEARDGEAAIRSVQADICGKDPGFAAVRLDDGRVLTCNVSEESEAYAAGLRCGSELISFDGMEINKYIGSTEPVYMSFADIDNLEFCRPIMAFGVYGDSAEVGFKAEDGSTVTAKITPSGSYSDRIRATMRMLFGEFDENSNFVWKDMGGDIAYMELNSFLTAPSLRSKSNWEDIRKLADDEKIKNPWVYFLMETTISEMKAAGKKKLILDLRSNGGGSLDQAETVINFFTSEPLYIVTEEYTNFTTGKTVRTEPMMTEGNYGKWEGDIVILVSPGTVSAAEIFTHTMKKLPGVTVMGLTDSGGSAMGVSGTRTALLGYQFPMYRMLGEDGSILIDSGTDMQGGLKRDVELKLDEEAFDAIFLDKKDYTLDEAVKYLQ